MMAFSYAADVKLFRERERESFNAACVTPRMSYKNSM